MRDEIPSFFVLRNIFSHKPQSGIFHSRLSGRSRPHYLVRTPMSKPLRSWSIDLPLRRTAIRLNAAIA